LSDQVRLSVLSLSVCLPVRLDRIGAISCFTCISCAPTLCFFVGKYAICLSSLHFPVCSYGHWLIMFYDGVAAGESVGFHGGRGGGRAGPRRGSALMHASKLLTSGLELLQSTACPIAGGRACECAVHKSIYSLFMFWPCIVSIGMYVIRHNGIYGVHVSLGQARLTRACRPELGDTFMVCRTQAVLTSVYC
jgi:hypothetical protein